MLELFSYIQQSRDYGSLVQSMNSKGIQILLVRGVIIYIFSLIVLLQRGIRINTDNKQLWLEYFKLEMLWIQKIKLRRKVLFHEEEVPVEEVVVPRLEIEESRNSIELDMWNKQDSNQSEAFEKALVELVIPRAVYRNAVKSTSLKANISDSSGFGV